MLCVRCGFAQSEKSDERGTTNLCCAAAALPKIALSLFFADELKKLFSESGSQSRKSVNAYICDKAMRDDNPILVFFFDAVFERDGSCNRDDDGGCDDIKGE